MGTTTDGAKVLVDHLIDQQQVLAAAQAKHATLMLEFADTRRRLDQSRITTLHGDGNDPATPPANSPPWKSASPSQPANTAFPAPSASPAD